MQNTSVCKPPKPIPPTLARTWVRHRAIPSLAVNRHRARGRCERGPRFRIVCRDETKARFSPDLRNLTLASAQVNRYERSGRDASEWVPSWNRCWFAARVVEVRQAYRLTIDRREAQALERILSGCESTSLEPIVCSVPSSSGAGASFASAGGDDPLALYDDNGNGRITCKEARRHGIAPVSRSHPAYRFMRDGVVCE